MKLLYSSPRPDFVLATILNDNGETEKVKVDIQYSQLPFSCSLYKAFGHSLSRCINNPEVVRKSRVPPSGKRRHNHVENNDQPGGNEPVSEQPTPSNVDFTEDFIGNMEMGPMSLTNFVVVMW